MKLLAPKEPRIRRAAALLLALMLTTSCAEARPILARNIPAAATRPPSTDPLVYRSASELARRIRTGELSSVRVVQAFLDQIARQNGTYNAVVLADGDAALRRAREADDALLRGEVWGPLHGVPVTVKDTFSVQGLRTTAGAVELSQYVPSQDAALVVLLRDAGAIILAKTNMATLAMDMQTTNELFGTTNNVWDVRRTAGGSSGGCATALATGMTPLSFGSDLAGSIRLPSAWAGVYGLKPTFGVVSMSGHLPPLPGEINGIRTMAVAGPMARSVEDLELALRVIARPSRRDATTRPLRPIENPPTSARALRFAYATELGGLRPSHEVEAAMEALVARLRAAGATVEQATPRELDVEQTWEVWGALVGMQGGYDRSNLARWFGRLFAYGAVRDIPHQRRILDPISVPGYMQALEVQAQSINAMDAFVEQFDAWIIPAAVTTAFPHQAASRTFGIFNVYDTPIHVDDRQVPYYRVTQSFTTLASVTENPVVTVPVGLGSSGMPVGVQLVGRRFDDLRLLRVAALIAPIAGQMRYPLEPEALEDTP